jgi:tRNA dimethylallyltransferase
MVAKKVISKSIIVCGPTASGKSSFALALAQKMDAVIINADSQQVYADLQVLSARPSNAEMQGVPHYLYGVLQGDEACNAGRWLKLVSEIETDKTRIFCGGTGMYLSALLNGIVELPEIPSDIRKHVRSMDIAEVEAQIADEMPENMRGNQQRMRRALEVKLATGKSLQAWHEQQANTSRRDDYIVLYQNIERGVVRERIAQRMDIMVEQGALEEVNAILEKRYAPDLPIMKALGVPEFAEYLRGKISLEQAKQKAVQNSQQYAKRQQTWFNNQIDNKIEIAGKDINVILNLIQDLASLK